MPPESVSSLLLANGDSLIKQLFNAAVDRLHQRGITLCFSPEVIESFPLQVDWETSPNPLKTLHGHWHRVLATVIENLLLDGQLNSGDTLSINLATPPSFGLVFRICSATSSNTCTQ